MRWAIGRFDASGLRLPDLEIYFAEDCKRRFGAFGRFRTSSAAPPWRIEVCTAGVYLHELAHAWDALTLSETDREFFLELRGLETWDTRKAAKGGREELARLVARVLRQGILNYPSEAQLADREHFERITGVPAPVIRLVGAAQAPAAAPRY